MADKRITELTNERLILGDGDFTIVDSNEGTYKYKLKRIVDSIPELDTTLSIDGCAADAKATGDEIADVKRDLNDLINTTFKNILDINTFEDGYYRLYADGFKRELSDYSVSGFIPVVSSQNYYFNGVAAQVCFFNASKIYISGTVLYNSSFIVDGAFVTPNGCAYITISVPITAKNNVGLFLGSKPEMSIPPNDFGGNTMQKYISSKNIVRDLMILNTEWTDGQYLPYADGRSSVSNADFAFSGAIPIIGGKDLCVVPKGLSAHVCFYASEKTSTFISGCLIGLSGQNNTVIATPDTANFVRISVPITKKAMTHMSYYQWNEIISNKKIYEVGSNRHYTSILSALEEIRTNNVLDATVVINPGIYNFIDEIELLKGSTYIENYSSSEDFKGYFLGNNITIIGLGNVVINCDYVPTENDAFAEYCSIFHVYNVGYTLKNIKVQAKGCRYIIHDDSHYVNSFKTHNCEISDCHFVDKGLSWGCIIGGGLYSFDVRNIHDCDFIIEQGINNHKACYYHTNSDSNESTIRINNCYCERGTFSITESGSPLGLATMYVSNCCVSETPYQEGNTYVKMIQWNNFVPS